MKQFPAFVKKEFFHILRDKRTMLILFGMPIVQMLLFGFALNMEVNNVRTSIYDASRDELSQRICESIRVNPYFDLTTYSYSLDEVNDRLRKGEIDLAVIIPHGFARALTRTKSSKIQVLVDASDPNHASIASGYLDAIISQELIKLPSNSTDMPPYSIDLQSHILYNPSMKSSYNFVPGIMGLVLIIICSIMTSVSIVREKEYGSMEMLLASPMRPKLMLFAKTIPYLVLSFINLISILLLSYFVLHVPIKGSLTLLLVCSLLYIYLSLALGMFVSTLVEKQVAAILIAGMGMLMPTLILSGLLFPIANMPWPLQWLSTLVPAHWYIDAVRGVMIQGLGLWDVSMHLLILFVMSAALTFGSWFNIKARME